MNAEETRGITVSENAMGFTTIRLHYTADPEKDPEHPEYGEQAHKWLDIQRSAWPDPNDFEREYEVNFFIGKGSRVFPEFAEQLHCSRIQHERRRTVQRGWDFGWHSPACILAQIDNKDRLLVFKEIVGATQSTKDFAHHVIDTCSRLFAVGYSAGFSDFCDPAGQHIKSIESEKSEQRDVEVLNGLGIYPRWAYGWSRKDGRSLIHQLLAKREDGTPGLYVDQVGCPILAQAFLGRYIYPEDREGKYKDEPDDKTHPYADVMAALRYLVTGLRGRLGVIRPTHIQPLTAESLRYTGYGTVRK